MKKLIYTVFTISLFGSLFAADPQEQIIGPFGTLNNRDNSVTIPPNYSQDLLNVDITPGGQSFKKRKGYGLAYTLTDTTSPIHGLYDFFDSNGNDVALSFNGVRMSASINGVSPVVIFSTGSSGATYDCTDSQGFGYCVNSSRVPIIKTNGQTQSSIASTSNGTMIETTPDRLALAGFSARPNDVDFSAAADFTSWTTGISATSAFSFSISAPGSGIKHITYAFNRIMWWKDASFGYILPGQTAADWIVRTISPLVGTLDNTSVYWQGILYWRGQDGHIYTYDGTNLQKISKEISGTIALSQLRTIGAWNQTTTANFNSGSYSPTTYIDTETVSNQLQLTFPDTFSSLRDGSSGSKNVWATRCSGAVSCTTSVAVSNGNLIFTSNGTNSEDQFVKNVSSFSAYAIGTTYYFVISSMSVGTFNKSDFIISISSINKLTGSAPLSTDDFFWTFMSSVTNTIFLYRTGNSSDGTFCTGTCQTGNSSLPATISLYLSTSNYAVTVNSSLVKSGTHTYPNTKVYLYMDYFFADTGKNGSAYLDYFSVSPETTTFRSAIKNAPSLTAWDSFVPTTAGTSHTFYIRSATNSFTVDSTTPSFTALTANSIPTVSTGTYFQIRDDIASLGSTDQPILYDFTQNWFEGSAVDKSYASYYNDSIWFSVTYGTGATTNNRILKYDLLNNGWLIYDIASNGFYLKNLDLYFGSPAGGYVYKYNVGDNDNGSAINAYWKSKDFIGDTPFSNDEYRNLSFYYSVQTSTLTVTYTVDGSSSTSYTVYTGNSSQSFRNSNRNLPLGLVGNSINLKIGNNAAEQPFEIFSERFGINPKPWNPTSQ